MPTAFRSIPAVCPICSVTGIPPGCILVHIHSGGGKAYPWQLQRKCISARGESSSHRSLRSWLSNLLRFTKITDGIARYRCNSSISNNPICHDSALSPASLSERLWNFVPQPPLYTFHTTFSTPTPFRIWSFSFSLSLKNGTSLLYRLPETWRTMSYCSKKVKNIVVAIHAPRAQSFHNRLHKAHSCFLLRHLSRYCVKMCWIRNGFCKKDIELVLYNFSLSLLPHQGRPCLLFL